MLISTDIGVATTLQILEAVRRGVSRQEINDFDALKAAMKNELLDDSASFGRSAASRDETKYRSRHQTVCFDGRRRQRRRQNDDYRQTRPAHQKRRQRRFDLRRRHFSRRRFRQLEIWAERAGVPLIQQKQGTDPAAVLFDALKSAKARNADVLIVDTAGRLHNKSNLMAELEKMKRIAAREVQDAPHETLLVIDAVTGQNGLEQARQFMKAADVTGIVLTKLDGTAKGGIAVAIAKELNLPIRYVGIGEQVNDLMVFDAEKLCERFV